MHPAGAGRGRAVSATQPGQPRGAGSSGPATLSTHGVARHGLRRRPSGEPPPLPRELGSGRYWLALIAVGLTLWTLLVAPGGTSGVEAAVTRADAVLAERLAALRAPFLTMVMRGVHALGSEWTLRLLMWGTILAAVVFRRWRHLFVLLASLTVVQGLTTAMALTATRPRPSGVAILGVWNGFAHPSRPVAMLAAVLIGAAYTLLPQGRWRNAGKWVIAGVLAGLGVARLYLGVDHPSDVVSGVVLGVTIPLVAFRMFVPNAVFPVTYRRGRTAHLTLDERRSAAIRTAVRDQLGLDVLSIEPFNLEGSFGSTPLRIKVAGDPPSYVFAKLLAASHMRADRWYKLGRTLRFGRLEDESRFSTVRRLVQYEDYMLRAMRDAGLPVAEPLGLVEITPEREYMLVTEFLAGAQESGEADIDEHVTDDALRVVRRMWQAGLAHRDIKPANVLVRDGGIYLIDVAFGQVRPSPWREAVDLANMMLVLGLRRTPELVYERALRFFTPDEIAEAFAATSEATRPSLNRMIRADGRDLLGAFRKLAPPHPRIKVQRWSVRRVGLTVLVIAVGLAFGSTVVDNVVGAGDFDEPIRPYTPGVHSGALGRDRLTPLCTGADSGPLFLLAQSMPRASLIPCVDAPPPGWSLSGMDVRKGRARLWFDSDRAGSGAVVLAVTEGCDVSDAIEVPSDEHAARRYEDVASVTGGYRGVRYYVFDGGCATYRFDTRREGWTTLVNEASVALGFRTRQQLAQAYRATFDGLAGP